MLISNWVSLSQEVGVHAHSVIFGNTAIFFSMAAPLVLVSIVTSVCAGMSEGAYNINMRIFFAAWALLLFGLTLLVLIYGYNNAQRLREAEESFHKQQLMRLTVAMAILFGVASLLCLLNTILLHQIDSSTTASLIIQAYYRLSFWIVRTGGALYAWGATSFLLQDIAAQRGRRTGSIIEDPMITSLFLHSATTIERYTYTRGEQPRMPNSNNAPP